MTRSIVRMAGRRARPHWAVAGLLIFVAFALAVERSAIGAETAGTPVLQDDEAAESYWADRERGWFWYQAPPPEGKDKAKALAHSNAAAAPTRPAELIEFDALQKRVEELRNTAIIRPTERNIQNYLAVQAEVIDKASVFADVAQRVIWANPEFDYTVTGRPVNAKALEVFDRQAIGAREGATMALAKDHALFFFFRSDLSVLPPVWAVPQGV